MIHPIFDFNNRLLLSEEDSWKILPLPSSNKTHNPLEKDGNGASKIKGVGWTKPLPGQKQSLPKWLSNNFASSTCDLTLNNGLLLPSLAQVTIKMLCPSIGTFNSAAALKSASHFPTTFPKFQRTGLLFNSSKHYSHSSAH